MNIEVNTNELLTHGQKLIDEANSLDSDISNFNSIINSLNGAWKGEDAESYTNLMNENFIVQLKELSKTLIEYGEFLNKASQDYENLENEFSSRSISV